MRWILRFVRAIAVALVVVSTIDAEQCVGEESRPMPVDSLRLALDARLGALEDRGFSGVVLVCLRGETVYEKGFGFSTCDGSERMTPDHVFLIGSITKEFLRVLAYKLEEEGDLRLDDPVGRFLPNLPGEKPLLTVRQLVEHTAGLPDLVDASGNPVDYTVDYDYEPVTREELLQRFARVDLVSTPGEKEQYSNLGYQILGVVLENASGENLETLLREWIFQPAGMTRTGYVGPDWRDVEFAEGCRSDGTRWGSPYVDGMWMEDGPSWNLRGAGGLLGTAQDLSRFMNALEHQLLFGAEAQERYQHDRLRFIERYREHGMGPAGSNGIFHAVFFWLAESDFRFVILSNRAGHSGEDQARELIRLTAPSR